jgi:hypothetical protein
MKLDIDRPPPNWVLNKITIDGINDTEVHAARVEYFDLTVQGIPGIQALSINGPPSADAVPRTKRLALV